MVRLMSPSSRLVRSNGALRLTSHFPQPLRRQLLASLLATRSLATINPGITNISDVWFTGNNPLPSSALDSDPKKPSDERRLKLGHTLRILQERLPTLLQSPLPSEILSPHISLHLFPSTHPHLPTVSGRVGYNAAIWTSPIAWGRVPIVGNITLEILSERMIKNRNGSAIDLQDMGAGPEQLVVRWRTLGKTRGRGTGGLYKGLNASEPVDKITEFLGGGQGENDRKEFTGLFIFEFDSQGRILSHTIEHVQEGGHWERCVGGRVVGLTDWLLGGWKGRNEPGTPCPAFYPEQSRR